MTIVTYAFDPTGRDAANLVVDELHTITEVNAAPYRIIIPTFAPFYSYNLKLEHIDIQGNVRELIEGVDFYLALPYVDATRVTGKTVYGGLPIVNSFADGALRFQYQTVGGPWCADVDYVYARLIEAIYNPRTTWWDQLTNVQDNFPPIAHDHGIDDLYQVDVLFQTLNSIRDAILASPTTVPGEIVAHMLNKSIHPQTPEDLGLGPIATMELATDEEVVGHQHLDKVVTLRQILLLLNTL